MTKEPHEVLQAFELRPFPRRDGRASCRMLAMTLFALSACGAAETAPSARAEQDQGRASPKYEIAGISPGMTSEQVAAAAIKAGYRIANESTGSDWRLLQEKASTGKTFDFDSKLRGVSYHELRKGGEFVQVSYIPMPQGSVAQGVSYSATAAVTNFDQASAELNRRYGKPSFSNNAGRPWSQWCSVAARSDLECLKQGHLTLRTTSDGIGMSTEDPTLAEQQKRLLLDGSRQKPSF